LAQEDDDEDEELDLPPPQPKLKSFRQAMESLEDVRIFWNTLDVSNKLLLPLLLY